MSALPKAGVSEVRAFVITAVLACLPIFIDRVYFSRQGTQLRGGGGGRLSRAELIFSAPRLAYCLRQKKFTKTVTRFDAAMHIVDRTFAIGNALLSW